MSTDYRDICLASQDQMVENAILLKAHAGGKKEYEAFKAEIYAGTNEKKNSLKAEILEGIEKKKVTFGHFETMSACGWIKRAIMNPPPRINATSSMSLEERLRAEDRPRVQDETVSRLFAAMVERLRKEDAARNQCGGQGNLGADAP
jgi:hypothetical protein